MFKIALTAAIISLLAACTSMSTYDPASRSSSTATMGGAARPAPIEGPGINSHYGG